MISPVETAHRVVALFNVSDDTVDMVQALLTGAGDARRLIWCHFAEVKKGIVDFATFMATHNPEVVIVEVSPPYAANWQFVTTMRDSKTMKGRGLILTTTNKHRLDEVLGRDSQALEIVGKPQNLRAIAAAITSATSRGATARLATAARTTRVSSSRAGCAQARPPSPGQ